MDTCGQLQVERPDKRLLQNYRQKNEENIHGSSGSGVKERDGNTKDVKRSRWHDFVTNWVLGMRADSGQGDQVDIDVIHCDGKNKVRDRLGS